MSQERAQLWNRWGSSMSTASMQSEYNTGVEGQKLPIILFVKPWSLDTLHLAAITTVMLACHGFSTLIFNTIHKNLFPVCTTQTVFDQRWMRLLTNTKTLPTDLVEYCWEQTARHHMPPQVGGGKVGALSDVSTGCFILKVSSQRPDLLRSQNSGQ